MDTVPRIVYVYKDVVPWLAVANIIIAVILLTWSSFMDKINAILLKWISTDKLEEALNKERNIDSHIIKARKVVGYIGIVLAVMLAFIYFKV